MSLKSSFIEVVDYLQNRGEMMKAYVVLRNAPSMIEANPDIIQRVVDIKARLEDIAEMQNYGTIKGKFNAGFVDPIDKEKVVKYQLLKKFVQDHELKKLVDVGCFSGWVGRGLSSLGISVHGIDIHPVIMQIAAFIASGSLATFEYLSVQKLGFTHPKEYDGAILFDVLEHCFDIEIVIQSYEMAFKDGGWAIINMPSVEGEQVANLHPLDQHEHLYSFSVNKINDLFGNKNNISIKKVINEGGVPNWWITYQV